MDEGRMIGSDIITLNTDLSNGLSRTGKNLMKNGRPMHGHGSDGFDSDAHMRKKDSKTIRYTTEYWFDTTSFYGAG